MPRHAACMYARARAAWPVAAAAAAAARGVAAAFPPGWNGQARSPPLGWRSWNSYGPDINHSIIEANIAAVTARSWAVHGSSGQVSLADLGYTDFGIDEGWEGCGAGASPDRGSGSYQHDVDGNPVANTTRFPDLRALVAEGQSKGLKMGWYLNGCACGESKELGQNYEGDIRQLHELGFDAAKFDNCGSQENMTKYANLMAATGKNYTIENCHWGQCWDIKGDSDANGCPTQEWCPFNLYRTSGDVSKDPHSWLTNLQSTIRFRDLDAPLSVPGCWAYPDMMEVGLVAWGPAWNRAHFGAWAISSSPLIIGADLTDTQMLKAIVPIIGNTEAIAINQQWAGHPGYLVEGTGHDGKFVVAEYCDGPWGRAVGGWSYDAATSTVRGPGGCLDSRWRIDPGQLEMKPCDGSVHQRFVFNTTDAPPPPPGPGAGNIMGVLVSVDCINRNSTACCIKPNGWVHWAMGPYNCDRRDTSQLVSFDGGQLRMPLRDGKKCWSVWDYPQAGYEVQVWAKPQPHGAVAVLVINSNNTAPARVRVQLNKLRVPGTVAVRDVWEHTDNGTAAGSLSVDVGAADSRFLLLTPAPGAAL